MNLSTPYDSYIGRNRLWRLGYIISAIILVVLFFIQTYFFLAALEVVITEQLTQPYQPSLLPLAGWYLANGYPPLVFGSFFFSIWMCITLISVSSHPTIPPRHFWWLVICTTGSYQVFLFWMRWIVFVENILIGRYYGLVSITNIMISSISLNFLFCFFITLLSVFIWFRYIKF